MTDWAFNRRLLLRRLRSFPVCCHSMGVGDGGRSGCRRKTRKVPSDIELRILPINGPENYCQDRHSDQRLTISFRSILHNKIMCSDNRINMANQKQRRLLSVIMDRTVLELTLLFLYTFVCFIHLQLTFLVQIYSNYMNISSSINNK